MLMATDRPSPIHGYEGVRLCWTNDRLIVTTSSHVELAVPIGWCRRPMISERPLADGAVDLRLDLTISPDDGGESVGLALYCPWSSRSALYDLAASLETLERQLSRPEPAREPASARSSGAVTDRVPQPARPLDRSGELRTDLRTAFGQLSEGWIADDDQDANLTDAPEPVAHGAANPVDVGLPGTPPPARRLPRILPDLPRIAFARAPDTDDWLTFQQLAGSEEIQDPPL